jgi:hypothetical protein
VVGICGSNFNGDGDNTGDHKNSEGEVLEGFTEEFKEPWRFLD